MGWAGGVGGGGGGGCKYAIAEIRRLASVVLSSKSSNPHPFHIVLIIIAVISIAPYLTINGEHTGLYKINKNVYI